MPNWLVLIIVGILIYGITLAPVVPPSWKPFAQWTGGVLVLVGIVLLLLIIFRIPLPGA